MVEPEPPLKTNASYEELFHAAAQEATDDFDKLQEEDLKDAQSAKQ
jgi:hypothetical protein